MIVVVLLLLVLTMLLKLYLWSIPSENIPSKRMPSLPIIGSVHLFFSMEILETLMKYSRKFGEPFHFRIFFSDYYYTQDIAEVREILNNPKTIEKGNLYKFFEWTIPNAMLFAKEAVWKKKRRCVLKAFSQRKLNSLVPSFNKHADKLVMKLYNEKDVPLLECVQRNILDSALEIMTGLSIDESSEEIRKIYFELDGYNLIRSVSKFPLERHLKPWLYSDFAFGATKEGKAFIHRRNCCNKIITHVLEKRKEHFEGRGNEHVDDEERVFIDLLAEGYPNKEDIVTEIMGFSAASSETSGLTLAVLFTLLGLYSNIQAKVYQEIMEVVGHSQFVDYNHLVKLKYTEMVLKETMRLFPAITNIIRLATSDISLGDKVISANTNILIPIYDIHRSERYWKDPLKFDPDRFLPENLDKSNPLSFFAFSSGPRNCIGGKYGIMQMKTVVVKVLKEYELSSNTKTTEDIKLETFMTPIVKEGVHCIFTPRIKY